MNRKISKRTYQAKLTIFVLLVAVLTFTPFAIFRDSASATSNSHSHGYVIQSNNRLSKNGETFFPFGFYHISDYDGRLGQDLANDVQLLADNGFNAVEFATAYYIGPQDSEPARTVARNNDMAVILSYSDQVSSSGFDYEFEWMKALKDDPSILAWDKNDDFNAPQPDPRRTPTEAEARHNESHQKAANAGLDTFVYASGGTFPYEDGQIPHMLDEYKNAGDIIGLQVYPISNNEYIFRPEPLHEAIEHFKYGRERLADKTIFANLQTFSWAAWWGGNQRYPTAQEMKNMTWSSLIANFDGIMAYAFYDKGELLTDNSPEVWNEMVALRADINGEFLQAYLDGTHTYIETVPGALKTQARMHAATIEYTDPTSGQEYVYVITNNPLLNSASTASKSIPLPISNTERWDFDAQYSGSGRYDESLYFCQDGGNMYLDGTMPAQQIGVYRFSVNGEAKNQDVQDCDSFDSAAGPGIVGTQANSQEVIGSGNECKWDLNGDQTVGLADFGLFGSQYNTASLTDCTKDFVGNDCRYTALDFADFGQKYNQDCSELL